MSYDLYAIFFAKYSLFLFYCMHSPQTLTILQLIVVAFLWKKIVLQRKDQIFCQILIQLEMQTEADEIGKKRNGSFFNFNRSRNEISTSWFSYCWFDGWNRFQRLFRFFWLGFSLFAGQLFKILFQFSLRFQLENNFFFLLKKISVKLNCFWCAWLMRTICSWGAAATRLKPYWAFGSCSSVLFDEYGFGNIR